jgi:hypothetical protein
MPHDVREEFLSRLAAAMSARKIGRVDPQNRLRKLSNASADRLELVGTVGGGPAVERQLHRRFSAARMNGEWFRPCHGLVDLLKSLSVEAA